MHVRYHRWGKKGVWSKLFAAVDDDPGLEYLMVDGSVVRVHQHGAAEKNGSRMGRWPITGRLEHQNTRDGGCVAPRGHEGNPVRLPLTAGQVSEHAKAEALIAGFKAHFVLADKGYGSDTFVAAIKGTQAIPVIPPKSNRKVARDYDKAIYKERNLVERLFQKLKNFRRIATRYERLARHYQAMLLSLVGTVIWLN